MRTLLVVFFLGCLAIPANLNADDATEHLKSGIVWSRRGEFDKAMAEYNKALAINPNDAGAYALRGIAWGDKGEYDKAIADYTQALAINPNDAGAYALRGIAWGKTGEYEKAIADYTQALAINPNDDCVYINRGGAWIEKGEYDKAISDYNKALAINPTYVAAYDKLAWLYATCPDAKYRDGKKAVEKAKKAYDCELRDAEKVTSLFHKTWNYLDTLAAAYAENGDFGKAREWEEKAIELAKADKAATDKDKAKFRSHLESYKQGKPWRDELKKK